MLCSRESLGVIVFFTYQNEDFISSRPPIHRSDLITAVNILISPPEE